VTELQQKQVLVVDDDEGGRAIVLTAVGYSLGRDETSAMVIRIPGGDPQSFSYRLVDGNAQGKPSTNGTTVNGKICLSHDLQGGDVISFASAVKALYCLRRMTEAEWRHYTDTVDYRPMKPANQDATTLFNGDRFNWGSHNLDQR